MKLRISIVLLATLVLVSCSSRYELIEEENLLVLEGASLFDGTGAPLRPNTAIVVQDDKIIRVGRVGDYRYPEDVTVLDLQNRYVLPGSINVHVHLTKQSIEEIGCTRWHVVR